MQSNDHSSMPTFKVRDKAGSDIKNSFNEECLRISVVKDQLWITIFFLKPEDSLVSLQTLKGFDTISEWMKWGKMTARAPRMSLQQEEKSIILRF